MYEILFTSEAWWFFTSMFVYDVQRGACNLYIVYRCSAVVVVYIRKGNQPPSPEINVMT